MCKSKFWHNAKCPICGYKFQRYKKYSDSWPKHWWIYCSDECYKKSATYKKNHQGEITKEQILEWWKPYP